MTFNPEKLEQVANKNSGNQIRSADWNLVVNKVQELGETKVDREGDSIRGDLAIGGKLNVGELQLTDPENHLSEGLFVRGSVAIGSVPSQTFAGGQRRVTAPLSVQAKGSSEVLMSFVDPKGEPSWHITQNFQEKPGLNFCESGVENGNGRLFIAKGGNVGIGTDNPQHNLEIDGSLKLESGVAINHFSNDGRLGNSDQIVPTQRAVKTYADTKANLSGSTRQNFNTADLQIQGNLTCRPHPIEVQSYTFPGERDNGKNSDVRTEYKTSDWICTIAGFMTGAGNIYRQNENISRFIELWMTQKDGLWHIRAKANYERRKDSEWQVWVMAISRGFARTK